MRDGRRQREEERQINRPTDKWADNPLGRQTSRRTDRLSDVKQRQP